MTRNRIFPLLWSVLLFYVQVSTGGGANDGGFAGPNSGGFGGSNTGGFGGANAGGFGGANAGGFGGANAGGFGGGGGGGGGANDGGFAVPNFGGFAGPNFDGFAGPNPGGFAGANPGGFGGANPGGYAGDGGKGGGANDIGFAVPNSDGFSGPNFGGFSGPNYGGFGGANAAGANAGGSGGGGKWIWVTGKDNKGGSWQRSYDGSVPVYNISPKEQAFANTEVSQALYGGRDGGWGDAAAVPAAGPDGHGHGYPHYVYNYLYDHADDYDGGQGGYNGGNGGKGAGGGGGKGSKGGKGGKRGSGAEAVSGGVGKGGSGDAAAVGRKGGKGGKGGAGGGGGWTENEGGPWQWPFGGSVPGMSAMKKFPDNLKTTMTEIKTKAAAKLAEMKMLGPKVYIEKMKVAGEKMLNYLDKQGIVSKDKAMKYMKSVDMDHIKEMLYSVMKKWLETYLNGWKDWMEKAGIPQYLKGILGGDCDVNAVALRNMEKIKDSAEGWAKQMPMPGFIKDIMGGLGNAKDVAGEQQLPLM